MLARGRVFSVGLLLADQNKRAPEAMRYWFRVLDLNCTGGRGVRARLLLVAGACAARV